MRWSHWLQSRGGDPSIKTEDYDPYLDPGCKTPVEVAIEEGDIRSRLQDLETRYANVKKARQPHPDIGCWWALYDYGLDAIKKWPLDHKHVYPGALMRYTKLQQLAGVPTIAKPLPANETLHPKGMALTAGAEKERKQCSKLDVYFWLFSPSLDYRG